MDDRQQFEQTLRQMGINPANIGRSNGVALPPIPASDTTAIQRNAFDGFYQVRSRDFWQHAEVTATKVEDFKTCDHYLITRGSETQCKKCYAGWTFPSSYYVLDGKLYKDEKALQFAH